MNFKLFKGSVSSIKLMDFYAKDQNLLLTTFLVKPSYVYHQVVGPKNGPITYRL